MGGIIGGVATLALVGVLLWWYLRRQRQARAGLALEEQCVSLPNELETKDEVHYLVDGNKSPFAELSSATRQKLHAECRHELPSKSNSHEMLGEWHRAELP